MDRNSHGYAYTHRRILERTCKGSKPLGKVVYCNSKCREHPHPQQLLLIYLLPVFKLRHIMDLMRVLTLRHELVNRSYKSYPHEKSDRSYPVAGCRSICDRKRLPGLWKYLYHRYIDHYPRRKTQRRRQKLVIRLLRIKRQRRTYSRRKSRKQRKAECRYNILKFKTHNVTSISSLFLPAHIQTS